MNQPNPLKRRRKRSSKSTSKYRLFQSDPRTFFLTDERRMFILTLTEDRDKKSVYTYVLAECAPRSVDHTLVSYAKEIYNTRVYDSSEQGAEQALHYMVKELCKGVVDIENPLEFALTLGGTINGRSPISTTGLAKSDIH